MMFQIKTAVSIQGLMKDVSANPLDPIRQNIEKLGIEVEMPDQNSLHYINRGVGLALYQMGKTIKLFDEVSMNLQPEQQQIQLVLSFRRLVLMSLFLLVVMSAFFCFLFFQSVLGLIPAVIMTGLIFAGNYFYSVASIKFFIRKSLRGDAMLLG